MPRNTPTWALLATLAASLAGCSDSGPSSAPTPVPQPAPPAGGIQIAGYVFDSAGRPLGGARVQVAEGPQSGLSTTADGSGRYSLTGAFDDTSRFRATKEGHLDAIKPLGSSCDRCNPPWWVYFYLPVLDPPVNLAGNYTLTFSADSACGGLPDDVRTRTYTATIATAPADYLPPNTAFSVTVSGSAFLDAYKSFLIQVAGNYISGSLGDFHGDPGVAEEVAPNTYIGLGGTFGAEVTDGSQISALFEGDVDYCVLNSPMGSRFACSTNPVTSTRCTSRNHRVTLTRR